ncbi:MAG TPA: amidohydrolase family protein [Thermoanaerobaculaceae bacterium]|nr:amidohydrolase family protein [Thermoanaerobaculaceae bacterium]
MRRTLVVAAIAVGVGVLCAAHVGAAPTVKALVGGTLVDGTGAAPVKDAVIVIEGDRIACAGTRAVCPVPAGAEVLDVKGSWVTPGLIDAHVHFAQTGWADGRPDSLDLRDRYRYEQVQAGLRNHPERFFRSYLCSGVTAVFDVGGYPWSWDLRAKTGTNPDAPHVAAAGPLLSTADFWLNVPAERQFIYLADEKAAREGVRYLAANGADAVKVWFIMVRTRPFEEMAAAVRAAGDEARKLGLRLIVHATGLKEAKEALRAGAAMLVHSVDDLPVDDEFIAIAKANGTIYCPTLTVVGGYLRMYEAAETHTPPTVDDPNGCVDAVTRAHLAETAALKLDETMLKQRLDRMRARVAAGTPVMADNLKRVLAAGIPIAMGTDAGNPLTLHGPAVYAEMEAMQADGMTPMQVVVASTQTAALALGAAGKDLGTVQPGKVADLLVVGADPTADVAAMRKVRLVVRAGVEHRVSELAAAR